MNRKGIVAIIVVLALAIVTAAWFYSDYRSTPQAQAPVTIPVGQGDIIKVALLNTDGTLPNQTKPGDISGCDHVILVERTVNASPATLRSALNLLLAPGEWQDQQLAWGKLYNYANRGTLAVDSVSIVNGIAKIYLKGTPPPLGGVCDDPRLFVQVAQTARQFSTVQKVQLFVNGIENTGPGDGQGL